MSIHLHKNAPNDLTFHVMGVFRVDGDELVMVKTQAVGSKTDYNGQVEDEELMFDE